MVRNTSAGRRISKDDGLIMLGIQLGQSISTIALAAVGVHLPMGTPEPIIDLQDENKNVYELCCQLPSGRIYRVSLEKIDQDNIHNGAGIWLGKLELSSALKKAAQAFHVAAALEGPKQSTSLLPLITHLMPDSTGRVLVLDMIMPHDAMDLVITVSVLAIHSHDRRLYQAEALGMNRYQVALSPGHYVITHLQAHGIHNSYTTLIHRTFVI